MGNAGITLDFVRKTEKSASNRQTQHLFDLIVDFGLWFKREHVMWNVMWSQNPAQNLILVFSNIFSLNLWLLRVLNCTELALKNQLKRTEHNRLVPFWNFTNFRTTRPWHLAILVNYSFEISRLCFWPTFIDFKWKTNLSTIMSPPIIPDT